MLLRLASLERSIAGRALFAGVDLDVRAGDRICVVGPNGAGKSTLLRIAAGLDAADGGEVVVPRGVRVGLLRQEIDPRRATSVRDEAATALAHLDALEAEMRALERAIAEGGGDVDESLAERYDAASARFHHADGFARDARVDAVLEGLGFDGAARARPLSSFSGGWLMRVELAKLLLSEPDVLLLDEPTNHLDLPAIEWFESVLDGFAGAVVAISHDRAFLRRQARRIAELDGLGHCTVYEHDYDGYLRERERRREERLALRARQDRQIAHLEQFVDRFRAKATKARQAQSRLKAIDRIERVEIEPEGPRGPRLRIPEPPRSGRVVLELEGVAKRYGDQVVYDGLDFAIERGERVALVGPNGAGKSTLLRIAAGALAFDAGERALGHNVETAYFAQHQLEALDARRTILEELGADASLADHARLRGHLGAFLFSGDDVQKRIGVLSGGEKARVALAKMLLRPCNLLVLDEPTNHLDTSACEVLEQALASYAGTLLFVSHDRSFINAIATRIVEVRPGEIRSFPGTYDDYRARLRELERGAADPGDAAPA
ncbi:MAG: ABC-F family ATP-binding cassette domain-containing protein, partial [Myxococcales bacterium]|nr:ABC-F family ATP-binding cassette domain-containing protein [Myxococcales bacterium]